MILITITIINNNNNNNDNDNDNNNNNNSEGNNNNNNNNKRILCHKHKHQVVVFNNVLNITWWIGQTSTKGTKTIYVAPSPRAALCWCKLACKQEMSYKFIRLIYFQASKVLNLSIWQLHNLFICIIKFNEFYGEF